MARKANTAAIPAEMVTKLSVQRQRTLQKLGNYVNDSNSLSRYYMLGFLENYNNSNNKKK